MSAAAAPVIRIEAPNESPDLSVTIAAVALVLLVAAAISFLAIRYLNWAMATRRFCTRVLFAGALPICIVLGLMIALDLSRGALLPWAVANLSRIPTEGRLMLVGMLASGVGLSWLIARRHDRRLLVQAKNDMAVFQ